MDVCAKVVEKIIRTYPIQFNPFRNISRMYDVEEGYEIIRQAKLVKTKYALHQELVIPHCDFTKNGRSALMQAVTKLEKEDAPVSVAIYTLWWVHLPHWMPPESCVLGGYPFNWS